MSPLLDRNGVIKEIVRSLGTRSLFISSLGFLSRELHSISDAANNFYMLGSMGLASSLGLGLSLVFRNKDVVVLEGDASILMNLGSLATIGNIAPNNYHLFILDNHANESTGGQKSFTAMRTDLLKVASSAGVERVARASGSDQLISILNSDTLPTVIVVECDDSNAPPPPIVEISAEKIRERFMKYIRNTS